MGESTCLELVGVDARVARRVAACVFGTPWPCLGWVIPAREDSFVINVADAAPLNQDHYMYGAFEAQSQVADPSALQSSAWQTFWCAVVERARRGAMSFRQVLARCNTPGFFELERRRPVHQRFGPGLSHASDSFWPLSEW